MGSLSASSRLHQRGAVELQNRPLVMPIDQPSECEAVVNCDAFKASGKDGRFLYTVYRRYIEYHAVPILGLT